MHSCLYDGQVEHRRLRPTEHAFRYGLYMAYLDLDELPWLLRGGYGLYRAAVSPATFRRSDHLGPPGQPLAAAVRDFLETQTAWRPAGPVRLLTFLRNWGYYFCPLSLYYCFDATGRSVEAVLAEVSNTPWLEKHWYPLWAGNRIGEGAALGYRHAKEFHVSPFLPMSMTYEWRLREPGEQLNVGIINRCDGHRMFEVGMMLRRRELSGWSMAKMLLKYPWMTGRASQAIYWQALQLWRKECPFFLHPRRAERAPQEQDP